jgi:hypothetical protein
VVTVRVPDSRNPTVKRCALDGGVGGDQYGSVEMERITGENAASFMGFFWTFVLTGGKIVLLR